MNIQDKKVLIISHNPLSRVNNNGKTLVSIFKGVPEENIYQIYLNGDIPDYGEKCHYLQLNEKQIISSVIHRKNVCCKEIEASADKVAASTIKLRNFGNHTKRLLRECVWKVAIWKSKLAEWLEDKQFDVVFFMAGDGMFAYDVYRHVMSHLEAKSCLFFTDDYIIGKTSRSPIAAIRRFLLKNKMKNTLKDTTELYVISEQMREAYREVFQMDSCVIRNFSVEKSADDPAFSGEAGSGCLTMVYAGGLHYNRWKVLNQIAEDLKEINSQGQAKCILKIYSAQNISSEILEKLNVEGGSEFCGGASASQISEIYSKSDILLHVESFDKKAIASTKYSFSTKIPEYLSADKCVLAVGPAEVASISYLSNFACTVSDSSKLSAALAKVINDDDYRKSVEINCSKQYEKDFSQLKQRECLSRIFAVKQKALEGII